VTLESTVRSAFRETELPTGDLFETAQNEGASELFDNARWEGIQPDQLRNHSAAVGFLAPGAFAYFLPALIIVSLTDAGVRDSLLQRLLPPKADASRPSFVAWWRLLSQPQRHAVVSFLEHCAVADSTVSDSSLAAVRSAVAHS
jgi:hypothetical protein